jgi:hypothetical protein
MLHGILIEPCVMGETRQYAVAVYGEDAEDQTADSPGDPGCMEICALRDVVDGREIDLLTLHEDESARVEEAVNECLERMRQEALSDQAEAQAEDMALAREYDR